MINRASHEVTEIQAIGETLWQEQRAAREGIVDLYVYSLRRVQAFSILSQPAAASYRPSAPPYPTPSAPILQSPMHDLRVEESNRQFSCSLATSNVIDQIWNLGFADSALAFLVT